ncbi:oligopeptide permease-like protein (plasmid) [Borrelia turcica IST7]|uniref:Oligopeptide permease-like protein n=1 Tax=Borrelia turcica IST7 TaxID=1104446 RepID=A0A386PPX7_9SPIR|nr:oligopeptide permease-like protein [Borrelia turcica]AYE37015.1 oligopeptide permease-like protein [Borrelia turcica IST7]
MSFSFKNSKLTKVFLVLLFASCSSLKLEHDEFNSKLRVYQHLNKNCELKGVFDYKNKITKIFLYAKFRNHSIVKQTPLKLADGTKIEGKTRYEYNNNAFIGSWINYSSFSLNKIILEKMLKEEEHLYNKEHIKIQIGLEEVEINKSKLIDFLSMLDATEKKYAQKK